MTKETLFSSLLIVTALNFSGCIGADNKTQADTADINTATITSCPDLNTTIHTNPVSHKTVINVHQASTGGMRNTITDFIEREFPIKTIHTVKAHSTSSGTMAPQILASIDTGKLNTNAVFTYGRTGEVTPGRNIYKHLHEAEEKGLLHDLAKRYTAEIAPQLKDAVSDVAKGGHLTMPYFGTVAIVYNKANISLADVPKSWEEFSNFNGKLAVPGSGCFAMRILTSLHATVGEAGFERIIQKADMPALENTDDDKRTRAQKAFHAATAVKAVTDGEFKVGVGLLTTKQTQDAIAAGTLGVIWPTDGAIMLQHMLVINRNPSEADLAIADYITNDSDLCKLLLDFGVSSTSSKCDVLPIVKANNYNFKTIEIATVMNTTTHQTIIDIVERNKPSTSIIIHQPGTNGMRGQLAELVNTRFPYVTQFNVEANATGAGRLGPQLIENLADGNLTTNVIFTYGRTGEINPGRDIYKHLHAAEAQNMLHGLAQRYRADIRPELEYIVNDVAKGGALAMPYFGIVAIVYNKENINVADVPKTWEEFSNFDGNLSVPGSGCFAMRILTALHASVGKAGFERIIQRAHMPYLEVTLDDNRTRAQEAFHAATAVQAVLDGRFKVGVGLLTTKQTQDAIADGKLGVIWPTDGAIILQHILAINSNPSQADLALADFVTNDPQFCETLLSFGVSSTSTKCNVLPIVKANNYSFKPIDIATIMNTTTHEAITTIIDRLAPISRPIPRP